MAISVGCQCGKRFQAKDELAGKRVKCPGCGSVLEIPTPQPTAAGGGDDLFGGGMGGDPLFAAGPAMQGGFGPQAMPGSAGPPRPRRKKGPNVVLIAGIAGGGVGLLLILGVVLMLALGGKRNTDVAVNPTTPAAPPVAPTVVTPTTPATTSGTAAPAPPPPAAAATANAAPAPAPTVNEEVVYSAQDNQGNSVQVVQTTTESDSGTRSPMSTGVIKWHAKAESPFRGAIAKEGGKFEDELIVYQFSWMSQLMPYLGYERIHKKFDFKKSWTEGENFRGAQYRIPQFLYPGDNRKSWKGYQFPNMGLTHFVGMSGVEETRQEVAAALDRSNDRAGIFGYAGVAKEADITDGKNQTIMVIGAGELIGPWVAGGGSTVRGARAPQVDEKTGEKTYDYFNSLDGFGSKDQSGPQALFADGSARTLNPKMDPSVFRAICTMHGKETVDLAQSGTSLEKFATQDFDPLKDEAEFTIKVVRRIGDGGDDDDDEDGDNSDSSSSSDDDDDDDSDDDSKKSDDDSGDDGDKKE